MFLFAILASYGLHFLIGVHHIPPTEWLRRVSAPNLSFTVLIEHLVMLGTAESTSLDDVSWTLVHEMRISLIFPAILISVTRGGWRTLLVYLIASVACTGGVLIITGTVAKGYNDQTFLTTILETGYLAVFFAAGAYLAVMHQKISSQIVSLPRYLRMLLIAVTILFLIINDHDSRDVAGCIVDYLHGLGAMGLIGLAIVLPKFATALVHRVPIWLGRISYSLYLVHVPILYIVTQTFGVSWSPLKVSAVVIALSFSVADLTARIIEFPTIKFSERLVKRIGGVSNESQTL